MIGASLSWGPATPYARHQFSDGFQPGEYSRFPAPPPPQPWTTKGNLPLPKPVLLGKPDGGGMSKNFDPSTPTGQLNINNLRKQQQQQQGNLPFYSNQPGFRDTRTPEIPKRSLARRFSTPVMLNATISNLQNQRYSLPNHAEEFAPTSSSQLEPIYSSGGNPSNTSNNALKRRSSYTPSPLSASDASATLSPRPRSVSVSSTTTAGTFHEKMRRAPIRRKPVGSGPYRCNSFTASIAESLAESVKSDDAASEIFDLYSEPGRPTSPEPLSTIGPESSLVQPERHSSQKSFVSYSSTVETFENDKVNMANPHKSTEDVSNVMLHNKPASGDLKVYFYEEPFQALSTNELLAEFSMIPMTNPLSGADVNPNNLSVVTPANEKEKLQPTLSNVSLITADASSFVTAPSSPVSPLDENYWSSNDSIYENDNDDCHSIETVPALIPPSQSHQNPRDSIASTISYDTTMESTSQCESNRTSIISRQLAYEDGVGTGKNDNNGSYLLMTEDDVTARPHSAPLTRLPDASPEGIDNIPGGGLLKRAMSTATPRTFSANLLLAESGVSDTNSGSADIVSVASTNNLGRFDSPIPFMGPLSEFDYYD